jgi:hypothetical protein
MPPKFHGWMLWALLMLAIVAIVVLVLAHDLTATTGANYILVVAALGAPGILPSGQGAAVVGVIETMLTRILAHQETPTNSVEVTKTTTVTRTLSPPAMVPVTEASPVPEAPHSTPPITKEVSS